MSKFLEIKGLPKGVKKSDVVSVDFMPITKKAIVVKDVQPFLHQSPLFFSEDAVEITLRDGTVFRAEVVERWSGIRVKPLA